LTGDYSNTDIFCLPLVADGRPSTKKTSVATADGTEAGGDMHKGQNGTKATEKRTESSGERLERKGEV
jgi:hypothetical protein